MEKEEMTDNEIVDEGAKIAKQISDGFGRLNGLLERKGKRPGTQTIFDCIDLNDDLKDIDLYNMYMHFEFLSRALTQTKLIDDVQVWYDGDIYLRYNDKQKTIKTVNFEETYQEILKFVEDDGIAIKIFKDYVNKIKY